MKHFINIFYLMVIAFSFSACTIKSGDAVVQLDSEGVKIQAGDAKVGVGHDGVDVQAGDAKVKLDTPFEINTEEGKVKFDQDGLKIDHEDAKVNFDKDGVKIKAEDGTDIDWSKDGVKIKAEDGTDLVLDKNTVKVNNINLGNDNINNNSDNNFTVTKPNNTVQNSNIAQSNNSQYGNETIIEGQVVDNENQACEQEYQGLINEFRQDFKDCYVVLKNIPCGETETKINNLLIILDSSGSMAGQINGKTKMQIAKESAAKFIDSIEGDLNIGLMVYGHKGNNQTSSKNLSCAGIEEIYSMGEVDKVDLKNTINNLKPTGWTPIADSLTMAQEILERYPSDQYRNTVLLISDGEETCDGNPSSIASMLQKSDAEIMVDVIGFDVGDRAESQLRDVADKGGGNYYTVRNYQDFDAVMAQYAQAMCFYERKMTWADIDMHWAECRLRLAHEIRDVRTQPDTTMECMTHINMRHDQRIKSINKQLDDMHRDADKMNPSSANYIFGN